MIIHRILNTFRNGLLLPQSSRMSNAAAAALNGTTASGPSVFKETPLTEGDISNNLRDELRRMKRRRQLVSQNIAAQMGNTAPNFSNSSINTVDNLPRSPRSAPSSPEPMFQEAGNMSPKSASSSHVPRASVSTSRELENSSNQMSQHETSVGLHADSSIQCNSSNVPSTSNRNIKALMGTGDKPVFTLKQMTLICERMCKVDIPHYFNIFSLSILTFHCLYEMFSYHILFFYRNAQMQYARNMTKYCTRSCPNNMMPS